MAYKRSSLHMLLYVVSKLEVEFTPKPLLQSQSLTCLRSEQVDVLSGSLDGSGCSYDHQGGLEKHLEGRLEPANGESVVPFKGFGVFLGGSTQPRPTPPTPRRAS